MNKEKVACYVRVSSSLQSGKDKYSIPEQKDILKRICESRNLNPTFFEDIGVSGETIRKRPQFNKMLNFCSDGTFKEVHVTDQDRLTRNPGNLQYIKDIFIENNVKLVINGDILDFNDEDDDFKSDINVVIGKRERKMIARRTARGKYQKAKQGKIPTAGYNIPYGYKCDDQSRIVINKEEARVVRMIFKWIANKGLSCYKIAEKLNTLGIPTRSKSYGKVIRSKINNKIYKAKWTRSSVNHIVRKELYFKDKYIYTSKFYDEPVFIDKEPIISKKLYEKARNQSTKNKSFKGRGATAIYILRGKMRCVKCGRAYVGGRWHSNKSGKTSYYYRDLGKSNKIREYEEKCTSASIKKDLVENIVKNDIKKFLVNPKTLELYLDTNKKEDNELKDIEYQITKNNSEMERLIDLYSEMFTDDPVQEKIIKKKIKEKKEKSKALQALKFETENKAEILKIKRDNLRNISYLLKKIGEGIEKLEDYKWKRIIDKLVDKIEIDSIGGHGKTVKLDINITYNFDKIVSEKPSHCTDQVNSASERSFKTCNS